MAKVKIGNFTPATAKRPETNKNIKTFFACGPADIHFNQITEVSIGCDVTIPEGFIGILCPMTKMIDVSSVVIENSGIVTGTFNRIKMRKGTSGSVRIRSEEPIATLILVPVEPFDFVTY